jgi:Mg2+-importing ATPase
MLGNHDAQHLVLFCSPDQIMSGLTSAEASQRLDQYGLNVLKQPMQQAVVLQFLTHFRNPLVLVLLAASGISALTGDVAGALIIGLIVLMSVTLDFVQAYRAGRAAEQLALQVAVMATVLRDGTPCEIPVRALVPGDVVLLSAGNLIPADAWLLEANDFFVNQAQLTGEPYPVEKKAHALAHEIENKNAPDLWALDAEDRIFMGSSVISGSATAQIGRTGSQSAFGQIALSLADQVPPTAFEVGTRRFGMLIMRLTLLLVLFTLLVNVALHRSLLESFLFAVALAVGLSCCRWWCPSRSRGEPCGWPP